MYIYIYIFNPKPSPAEVAVEEIQESRGSLLSRYSQQLKTKYVPRSTHGSALLAREFFIDNILVRIHSIIVMMRWTGLAPWEFEFSLPGSLTSTFLDQ